MLIFVVVVVEVSPIVRANSGPSTNSCTGMAKITNTKDPTKRPYFNPFDGLLMFRILVLYRNNPDIIPIAVATRRWSINPAMMTNEIGE